jgi:hypothetical protein
MAAGDLLVVKSSALKEEKCECHFFLQCQMYRQFANGNLFLMHSYPKGVFFCGFDCHALHPKAFAGGLGKISINRHIPAGKNMCIVRYRGVNGRQHGVIGNLPAGRG